mmetsp:Transcript_3268/g.7821  ORF Transcript_3268/g.7821 Transcript_3268/m.7821 type:complete len:533 (-) Transcript_3268:46-1644(-)
MRGFVGAAFFAAVAGHSLRHGRVFVRDANVVEDESSNIWVPITLPQQSTKYFNPSTGENREAPPRGAVVMKEAQVTGYGTKKRAHKPTWGEGVTFGKPGEQFLPDDVRKSCVPHCTWNCTQPVCEQDCEPVCRAGQCETRCPKMNTSQLEKCNVQCSAPECSMYCPSKKDDLCQGNKTLGCPKCATRCQEPKCNFVCNNDLGDLCKTVCPDPVCTFDCKKPKVCPNPHCNMVCEKPPDCDTHPTLPPMGDETVVGSGLAQPGMARWRTAAWNECSNTCGTGTQERNVQCSTQHEDDCDSSDKPPTQQKCEEFKGCMWVTGEWGECSTRCYPGKQTRKVDCSGAKCLDKKPATEQDCDGESPECKDCKAVVYGGPEFDGWSLEFTPGEYSVSDMEAKGAKCDDISSVKVFGVFCETDVYQYGDFNKAHQGWNATLKPGAYNRQGLLDHGAQDNDISSMKVRRTFSPHIKGMPTGMPDLTKDMPSSFPTMRPENFTKGLPKNLTKNPFEQWNPFSSAPAGGLVIVAALVSLAVQ